MAHILLTILKILGIIILCILGIIIFVLVAVLFAPFRYSLDAKKKENDSIGESSVKGKVTWMWILLRCRYVYENGESVFKIRVLGIDIQKLMNLKKARKPKKSKKEQIKNAPKQDNKVLPAKESSANPKETVSSVRMQDNIEEVPHNVQEKKSLFSKLKDKANGIKNKIESIKLKIIGIKNKVKDTINKIRFYKDELAKDEYKAAIRFMWNKVKEMLNHIKPRKLRGNITFGMESPDKTGQALGIIAVFYPVYGNNFSVKPDFTDKCLYGNIIAKGRIRIFTLLVICIKLIRSSEFKKLRNLIGK